MAKEFAVVELISNIILGRTDAPGHVDFFPQKPPFPADAPYEQPLPRATPESQGISSDHLAALIRELDASRYTDMHHLMILRHGKVVCECNFAPYRSGVWHITHSMCKSITGMAIGLLVSEGKLTLNENIYKIFENRHRPLATLLRPEITVENLLTMTSPVPFNEAGIVSGNDWLASYLNAPVLEKPGETFQYNSLNTYVLSAIVTERTGQTLAEYLTPRLFAPLGITKYFWETCPKGINKGGWGLFLCAEDMAKLGQLYLQKGKWNGVQIIPPQWVETSTMKHIDTGKDTFGYGYQIWMEQRPGSFEFNGMLGQNVVVYPDMDMVIVTNAGNNELFQNCVMLNIIRKYFPNDFMPADALPENPCAHSLLLRLCAETENGCAPMLSGVYPAHKGGWRKDPSAKKPIFRLPNTFSQKAPSTEEAFPSESPAAYAVSGIQAFGRFETAGITGLMHSLDGLHYELTPGSLGLFPLMLQVFHNNMTEGVKELSFTFQKGVFTVNFLEAGAWHPLRVGFGRAEESTLTLHEESYLIATLGEFTRDENGVLVLKLTMTFLEEAVRRKIHIFFHDNDSIELRWYETPGKDMILEGLGSITQELANRLLFTTLAESGDMELIHRLLAHTIEPVSTGKLIFPETEASN